MKKLVLVISALVVLAAVNGCSSNQFLGLNNPTDIPTRTPRPTFTPKPSATVITATDTPAATDTLAPTDTPEVASTDTPAPKPTAAKATARPVQPTAVPPPPKPALPVFLDASMSPLGGTAAYPCYQEGSFYEVIIYAKKVGAPGKRVFAPGLSFGAFSGSTLLQDYGGKQLISVTDDGGMSGYAYGSNCQKGSDILNPDRFNGKLDVGDVVRSGTTSLVIRFVKSANDLTPQSADIRVDFPKPGRWWIYLGVQ